MRKIKPYFIGGKFFLLIICCFMRMAAISRNNPPPLHRHKQFSDTSFIVPVVFHIIGTNPSLVTDQQISDAVADLNNAFANSGPYSTGGPGANTKITFCLAKTDPDGGITSGITRTQSVLGDLDQDLEDSRLKKLVSWDTKQYCNIWLVHGVENEYYTNFSCGNWSRRHNTPYTSYLPGGDFRDGIVDTGFGTSLAMLMGMYLGLKYTFVWGSCSNNNCNSDGDGVCDTPPASAPGASCTGFQNSCNSDTVSGFTKDMPDLVSNFMSFTGTCTNSFTEGQAAKMRSTLDGPRYSLLTQNKCGPPCAENITASFTRDNWNPVPGDLIHFTSSSTGGTNYQWSVNGVPVGGNGPAYAQSFSQTGGYKVMLKVFNSNQNCFASYSDSVIVSCGVMARFTPDVRVIASKDQILNDSIFFTNRSVNASSYQWWISNNTGLAPQIISTSFNLNQVFHSPGLYAIWLVASNGSCHDTSASFSFNVFDPTVDGTVSFQDVQCYENTKVRVTISVCNHGYAPAPAGTPVTFYSGDPNSDTAKKLNPVFTIPTAITGNCCTTFTTILDIGYPGLNQLYAVFNDNGNTKPLKLPNTSLPEISYTNNSAFASNFQFKVKANPPLSTLEPGDTLQLSATAGPGLVSSYLWSTDPELNCHDCANPVFIAAKKDVTEKVVATSGYNCTDSSFAVIKIPPADDYTITIDSLECASNNQILAGFTVCNQFKRGIIPDGLKVSFYDGDPATDTAHLLQPVFTIHSDSTEKCMSFTGYFHDFNNGTIFVVVNDPGIQAPLRLPADSMYTEKDYTNNTAQFTYQPGSVKLQPSDTSIYSNHSFPISIVSTVYDLSSTVWDPGPGYSLNCSNCLSPVVTAFADAVVTMHTNNPYGCQLKGSMHIRIVPPDLTTEILETHCYTNDSLLVRFNICEKNGYDSISSAIPVSFYDGVWGAGQHKLLGTSFKIFHAISGSCDSFSTVVKSPASDKLSVVVNDKGQNNSDVPDTAISETDYTNNSNVFPVIPFSATVSPSDTTVPRLAQVPLQFQVFGGQLTSFSWDPAQFLSCSACLTPIAVPPYTLQFELEAHNEYACTAKAYAQINTQAGGKVSIPNAFTPNGDGHNDIFYIMGGAEVKIVKSFSVFNRWGQEVFKANNFPPNDPRFGWNGLLNGKPSSAESYVYVAVIEFTDGSEQLYKGSVILIQ
jgi:gliding motility-associated-like protein